MKKVWLSLGVVFLSAGSLMAQDARHHGHDHGHDHAPAAAPAQAAPAESIKFDKPNHDFGTLTEGPSAEHVFKFTNTGKEPIVVQRVQASCGCTTPSYTKEPIAPGQAGSITAAYNTSGRPGAFNKTLTVFYNVGSNTTSLTKTLSIAGNVEKAPTSSVPENNSMMKLN